MSRTFTEAGVKLVQMSDRVWADEPGFEVAAKYSDDFTTVKVEILKNGAVMASATLGRWSWERLQTMEEQR